MYIAIFEVENQVEKNDKTIGKEEVPFCGKKIYMQLNPAN